MKIGIIDADLIGRNNHRFPNLACMKMSGSFKEDGHDVHLLTSYDFPADFDLIYVSKVFTDTPVPKFLSSMSNVLLGGTGFFFDKATPLPRWIEHHMPDYHLYDDWVQKQIESGKKAKEFEYYTNYSIGFLTRGCFRKCSFCVNQNYDTVKQHSLLSEFYDPSRKKICLLDDNFFGYGRWEKAFIELQNTNKPFQFKQGLDERLLNSLKCSYLFSSKYDGDVIFAFDNVEDYGIIEEKLKLINAFNSRHKTVKFYVLVGFKSTDSIDIENAFVRIELLFRYGCIPCIMRYMSKDDAPWKSSSMKGMYTALARWCNQPAFVKKMSFREFCVANQKAAKTDRLCSAYKSMSDFEREYPEIAKKYFDVKFGGI